MLRYELENQKNDLKESNQQLDEAIKKADGLNHEMEQLKIIVARTKNEELETLQTINSCQEEQILKV